MELDKMYIKGLLDATLDNFEQAESHINPDKDLQFFFENIYNSKDGKVLIGIKVEMTWITKLSHDVDDNVRNDLWIKVYAKDTVSGFMSDVFDMFDQINKAKIQL